MHHPPSPLQICHVAERIRQGRLHSAKQAQYVLAEEKSLKALSQLWKGFEPGLVTQLRGVQLLNVAHALHTLIDLLDR